MSQPERIPVVMLNYNGWRDTFNNIERMRNYIDSLWVVDNGSDHDRTAELKQRFPHVEVLRLDENYGWAGGYNRALDTLRALGYQSAYLLNNDAYLEPGALEAAATSLKADPRIAAVGSVILTDDGGSVWYDGEYHHAKPISQLQAGDADARTVNGAGFALRLSALDEVGKFHEDYFLYHEEADWFWRARKAGFRLVVSSSSRVHHEREGSDQGGNSLYYRMRNRYLALARGIELDGVSETHFRVFKAHLKALAERNERDGVIIIEALIDGMRGRFGKRVCHSPLFLGFCRALAKTVRLLVLPRYGQAAASYKLSSQ